MRAIAAAIVLALTVAGCAGLDSARRMTAGEIAAKPDPWVCSRLASFAYRGRMPDAWAAEAGRRGLAHCIDNGLKKRAEEQERAKRPIFCDHLGQTQDSRCW
ncbi:MAG: hypothetical protein HQ481_20800 [Alphaproteobacteria bacterium]|nr:hypothetical protein [Alphaproteobacteria bacterium]